MLTVHHLGVSQSERVVWLCEELEIPYELVVYDRDPVTRLAPPEYKALHPMGTAPVITDGDLVLSESGAIMEYIIARHGEGRLSVPPEDSDFPEYLFWMHFANGSVMPAEMIALIMGMLGLAEDHPLRGVLGTRGVNAFALIEKHLGEAPWFAGSNFSAADIIMVFPLTTMRAFVPMDLTPYPNIRAYLKRVGERPGYQRAMAKGDPGMAPMLE
jgi:glutathione S-transferase